MLKNLFSLNKKGITVTSLTIYVIVATIVVGVLVFLNANFFSNINDLTDKANIVSECLDFKSAFIRDLKSENDVKVTDYNNNLIRLSNNVKYEIRVLDKNAENKRFAIYRNDVQIAKSVVSHTEVDGERTKEGPYFEYDVNTNTVKVGIKFSDGDNVYLENQIYVVGKQPEITWENSHNNVKEPIGGDEVADSKAVYAILYNGGILEISNTGKLDETKTPIEEYGEVSKTIVSGNPAWLADKNLIKTVDFKERVELISLENLFADCIMLESVSNMGNISLGNFTSAASAFKNCTNLKSIDIENLDTTKIVNMSHMFDGCKALTNLDVSYMNTMSVTDASYMFSDCSLLENINVSDWNVSNVKNMEGMFQRCSNITELDVSDWNTTSVEDTSEMFHGATNLETLDVSNWDVSNVGNMEYFLFGCENLKNIDVSKWDVSEVKSFKNMFADCYELENINMTNWEATSATDYTAMFSDCSSLTLLDVSGLSTRRVASIGEMFEGCYDLKRIIGLENFDTSNVTNMKEMFNYCNSLTALDLSSFDTSMTTSSDGGLNNMFANTNMLRKITFGEEFNFLGDGTCINGYPKKNSTVKWYSVTTGLEYDPEEIPNNEEDTYIITSQSVTLAKGTDFLQTIPDTVTAIKFTTDVAPEGIDVIDVSEDKDDGVVSWVVGDTYYVSTQRENIRVVANEDSSYLFSGCSNLTNLDLTFLDTTEVWDVSNMFQDCKGLSEILVGPFWLNPISNKINSQNMFLDCGVNEVVTA